MFALEEETAVQALVGSIVWSREMCSVYFIAFVPNFPFSHKQGLETLENASYQGRIQDFLADVENI